MKWVIYILVSVYSLSSFSQFQQHYNNSKYYISSNLDSALYFADSATLNAVTFEEKGKAYYLRGYIYEKKTNFIRAFYDFNESLAFYESVDGFEIEVSSTLQHIGIVFLRTKNKNAIDVLKKSIAKKEEINDTESIYRTKRILAEAYKNEGIYDSAIIVLDDVFEYYKKQGNYYYQAYCYFDLGNVLLARGDYKLAVDNFNKSYEVLQNAKKEEYRLKSRILNNIGWGMYSMDQFDQALNQYHKSLRLQKQRVVIDSSNYMITLVNLARCHSAVNSIDSAMYYYKEVIDAGYKHGDEIINSYINMAELFETKTMYDSSTYYYKVGVDLLKKKKIQKAEMEEEFNELYTQLLLNRTSPNQDNRILILYSSLLVLGFGSLITITYVRRKRKKLISNSLSKVRRLNIIDEFGG